LISYSLSGTLNAQTADWEPTTREIAVDYTDSLVRAHVLIRNISTEASGNLMYYWFNKSTICNNMGGFAGALLHGEYQVFDRNNRMITQGYFENGLKQGVWKFWYPDGTIKMQMKYRNGLPDREVKNYNSDGSLIEEQKPINDNSETVPGKKSFFHWNRKNNDSSPADSIPKSSPAE
jgi:hypothetical protein